MARVIALAASHAPSDSVEILRCILVCACALALAAAGHPFLIAQ